MSRQICLTMADSFSVYASITLAGKMATVGSREVVN